MQQKNQIRNFMARGSIIPVYKDCTQTTMELCFRFLCGCHGEETNLI